MTLLFLLSLLLFKEFLQAAAAKEKDKQLISKFSLPDYWIKVDERNSNSSEANLDFSSYYPFYNLDFQLADTEESDKSLCKISSDDLNLKQFEISNKIENFEPCDSCTEISKKWRNSNNLYILFENSFIFHHYQLDSKNMSLSLKLALNIKEVFADLEVLLLDVAMKPEADVPDLLVIITRENILKLQLAKNKSQTNVSKYRQDAKLFQKVGNSLQNNWDLLTLTMNQQEAYLLEDPALTLHLLIPEAVAHDNIITEMNDVDPKYRGRKLKNCNWNDIKKKFFCIDPDTGIVEVTYQRSGSLLVSQVIVNKKNGSAIYKSRVGPDRLIFVGKENSTHSFVFYLTAPGNIETREIFFVLGKVLWVDFSENAYFIFTSSMLISSYLKEFSDVEYRKLFISAQELNPSRESIILVENTLKSSSPRFLKANFVAGSLEYFEIGGIASVKLSCENQPAAPSLTNQAYEISFFSRKCPNSSSSDPPKNFSSCFIHQKVILIRAQEGQDFNPVMNKSAGGITFEGEYRKEITSAFWKVIKIFLFVAAALICVSMVIYYIFNLYQTKKQKQEKKTQVKAKNQFSEAKKIVQYDDVEEDGDETEMNYVPDHYH